LLHVLRRENEDDRTFKRKVRDEVLSFVLLLPNRIDQEHFVKIVAKTIDSTTEAVRFELNHLREQAEKESIKQERYKANEINRTSNNTAIASDDGTKANLFLSAAITIIDKKLSTSLETELAKVVKISSLDKPSESELAGMAFSLEQQFAKLPDLAVKEELVNRLNRLKTILIRSKLTGLKKQLVELEETHDEKLFTETMRSIGLFEAKLREPAYSVETFGV